MEIGIRLARVSPAIETGRSKDKRLLDEAARRVSRSRWTMILHFRAICILFPWRSLLALISWRR